MQFSIEQIRSLRGNYREPPYPNFSLDEVVRRRKLTQTKLVRGENAWVAKGTAQTTEEWVARLVQGTLNKLTEKNKDLMMERLRTRELFATKESMSLVVDLIFRKALDEPENAKLYAGVCLNLAIYEANVLNELQVGQRPVSHLRDAIISTAQKEFRSTLEETLDPEGMCEEELEFLRSNTMRRKRSNMHFIGELYLCTALTQVTMFQLIKITMRGAESDEFPRPENIELLVALLNTVGERLDSAYKSSLDPYIASLAGLIKRPDCNYPHRIRFKIMDLLDLRKAGWGSRPKPIKAPATSASPAADRAKDRKAPAGSPMQKKGGKTYNTSSPTSAGASGNWRDAGTPKAAAGNGAAAASSSSSFQKNSTVKFASSSASPSSPSSIAAGSSMASRMEAVEEPPLVNFDLRVMSIFQEWVADRTNDIIPRWVEEFNNCDREFQSEEELCIAVATRVITEACLTTRRDAQREAFSFLVVGLFMTDAEVFIGFASTLAAAIEDGLLEDVPRFSERFMQMLRLSSTEEETRADVYYDTVNVLRMAYNRLSFVDDYTIETLMDFWSKVPQPSVKEEEAILLELPVIYSLCNAEGAGKGLEKLLSRAIHSMVEMGLIDAATLAEFLSLDDEENALYASLVRDYTQRYP